MGREEHNGGFIALHRSILDWEWYSDINTRCLFIHLLLTANFKDKKVKGQLVQRGQILTSTRSLAYEIGLSFQQTRTALEHLKSTGEITSHAGPQGTVITVKNYASYQEPTHQPTDNQQTTNTQPNKRATHDQHTTSNNDNKEINISPKSPKGEEYNSDFLAFWAAYPRKVGKGAAWKAFRRLCPDSGLLAAMLEAVGRQRGTQAWKKDGGQFIPHPATWLNQRRWEDEPDTTSEEDNDDDVL